MNVNDTIVFMMRAYPSLNRNRMEALNNLFNGSHAHWVDGELVLDRDSGYYGRGWLDAVRAQGDPETEKDVGMKLHVLREQMEVKFIYDNAELLAQDICAKLVRQQPDMYWISSYDDRWGDMPEDVTDEWAAAGDEIAWEVYRLTEGSKHGTHAYNSHRVVLKYLSARGKIDMGTTLNRIRELEAEAAKLRATLPNSLKGDE